MSALDRYEQLISGIVRAGYEPGNVGKALARIGIEATNRIKSELSKPGTGRIYMRGRVAHRASAPGEPPAVDTGRLRSSYHWRLGADARLRAFVDVGTNVEYAPYLEFGTSRMRPRPHVRPVFSRLAHDLGLRVAEQVVRGQKDAIARLPREIEL